MSKEDEDSINYDLPRANITRIVKRVVPDQYSLSNEAKVAFSKAAVVFIMYLTATSQEQAAKHKRSTLREDDVKAALDELDLGMYREELERTLQSYRASQQAKNQAKKKKKEQQSENVPST